MPTLRLFVAVDLGPEVGAAVARAVASVRLASPHAKWVGPSGAHLTLAFLGAVAEARVPEIAAALVVAAGRPRPFDLEVAGAGTFGRASSPRVLWLGVGGDLGALARLQREIAAGLAAIGFPPEDRAFRPHLTLARAREVTGDASLVRAAERLRTFEAGSTHVTVVHLMQSHLGGRGARYTVLAEAPLGRAVSG